MEEIADGKHDPGPTRKPLRRRLPAGLLPFNPTTTRVIMASRKVREVKCESTVGR